MAGTIINTLYPPQIESVAPAFAIEDSSVNIFYAFSPYNTILDASLVHIALVSQDTNENVLNTGTANTGIIIQEVKSIPDKGYYITLKPENIIKEKNSQNLITTGWTANKIYKLQIRFDATGHAGGTIPQSTATYLNTNQENFSEWSTVCLLQPINRPELVITKLSTNSNSRTVIRNNILLVSGGLKLANNNNQNSKEKLKYYIIKILNTSGGIIYSTDKIYTENQSINQIVNLSNLNLTTTNYTVRIEFTTSHLYSGFKDFFISIGSNQSWNQFDPTLNTEIDDNNGLIILKIKNTSSNNRFKTLYVRRASSWDNFSNWEDFKIINLTNGNINLSIIDNTIESLVWYKYSVQVEYFASDNNYSNNIVTYTPTYEIGPVINNFYDAILSRNEKQIKLTYNFSVSSYKQNINRTKFDTLGSKYPKFAENGHINYTSIQIGGLISSQEDEQELFLKKSDIFTSAVSSLYNQYNNEQNITEYNDFLWERVFRKELLSWLNDGQPKLFRSESEGNMVVILTDISLTPFQGTSRRLYNFTATGYEVADSSSLKELNNLGVFSIE